jgi:hypothetical protein
VLRELDRSWVGLSTLSTLSAISAGQLWAMSLGGYGNREVSLTGMNAIPSSPVFHRNPYR